MQIMELDMGIVELLKYPFTEKEKSISDMANKMLAAFVQSQNSSDFRYTRFHSEPSNDPCGYRVIYIENMGYTLVAGDGDKGFGWHIDGVGIYENINSDFKMFNFKDVNPYGREEIAFITDFEDFLDYLFKKVLKCSFTSSDFFNNQSVKEFIDLNADIRYMQKEC